jgi:SAM-dependent methyltransferase
VYHLFPMNESADLRTAEGFADYFRTIGAGSRYSAEQFRDFFAPLEPESFRGKDVIELGFGHGSFLLHWEKVEPARLSGVELGDTVDTTCAKLAHLPDTLLNLQRGDLVTADLGPHDLAYCIGVLHHLDEPFDGFEAVLRHTRPGGRFHCWVYAREGNGFVIHGVDVIRRLGGHLPWWATKWVSGLLVALPLFAYTKALRILPTVLARSLPLHAYCASIADRDFAFFHFLATDFLVARHTVYLDRGTIGAWLAHPEVEPGSTYLIHRNGNSWKFGGRKRAA